MVIRRLMVLALLCTNALAAIAPDSIAGKAFHGNGGFTGDRTTWVMSIVFSGNGRYTFTKVVLGSVLGITEILTAVPKDGTYTYGRTGETTGTFNLSEPGGSLYSIGPKLGPQTATSMTVNLTFSDATHGQVNDVTFNFPFSFTDVAATQNAPVVNVSMRGNTIPGRPLIVGFVIPAGGEARDVLIRAAGPALTQFGVSGAWANPDFRVHAGSGPTDFVINGAHYDDWSAFAEAELTRIFNYVGAFPFALNSKDAAAVLRLGPGAYTVVCNPTAGDAGGDVLVEVYLLP